MAERRRVGGWLEFGPFAAENRKKRGEGKPETFNFLGFIHICGQKRGNGRFTVLRQTIRKRLQAKLSEVKAELVRAGDKGSHFCRCKTEPVIQ
jgi:hypothetical protein